MKIMKFLIPLFALTLLSCGAPPEVETPESPPVVETPEVPETPETPMPQEETPIVETPETSRPLVPASFSPGEYELVDAFPSLSFAEPLELLHGGDGEETLYVVERGGKVYVFNTDASSPERRLFLDLSHLVDDSGQEMGLLGLAFHPDFEENGYLFANYTRNGQTLISRFISTGAVPVDPSTEKVLLTFSQPYSNHNGGSLLFGPDGYLYISSGDGGSGGDPKGNGQNLSTYLGKMLRIRVDEEDDPYSIPEDNPFKDGENGALPEIYAYGLRNPWKFSFDAGRELLIAADVGQGEIEEIDLIVSGGNYGWNRYEGTRPFKGNEALEEHILPVFEYDHSEGKSITGGYVYYGQKMESLRGAYIYGDFVSGTVWALWLDEDLKATNHELLDTELLIASFGVDKDGEIYIVDLQGKIYALQEKE